MSATQISANAVLDLIKIRHSYYPLSSELTISQDRVTEIVTEALKHVPSAFNSQSTRVVILFDEAHHKLWDITKDVLRGIVADEEKFKATSDKMDMFRGAAGSVMFFEDQEVVEGMQAQVPSYADKFPVWATQSDAMLQFAIWTALEAEGLGANLQHYNPVIDERVSAEWKTPSSWRLNAQLVFGGKTGEVYAKEIKPVEERLRVFKA
jgi:uncharacterized protein